MKLAPDFRSRLEEILSCPTAPFAEGRVHAVIRAAVRASKRLRDRVDAHGNLLVRYGPRAPRLLFACHTDHPALLANGDGTATIRGGIRPEALRGARVRTFDNGAVATVSRPGEGAAVVLRGAKGIPRGTPLILDLPAYRFDRGRIRARAIDDLCAVAACLTAADRLARGRWKGSVGFLFTRAEEVGFAGALAWTRTTRVPRTTTIVNLEMSNARPHTPQGEGPILRVGDRLTTFTPDVSAALERTAQALAKRDASFAYQRALMDGGACEATVYAHAGFPTGALCLPLKNYHNHNTRGGMGLEYVDQRDAENLVRWMVGFARAFGRAGGGTLARRLKKLWSKNRRALERTAHEGEG